MSNIEYPANFTLLVYCCCNFWFTQFYSRCFDPWNNLKPFRPSALHRHHTAWVWYSPHGNQIKFVLNYLWNRPEIYVPRLCLSKSIPTHRIIVQVPASTTSKTVTLIEGLTYRNIRLIFSTQFSVHLYSLTHCTQNSHKRQCIYHQHDSTRVRLSPPPAHLTLLLLSNICQSIFQFLHAYAGFPPPISSGSGSLTYAPSAMVVHDSRVTCKTVPSDVNSNRYEPPTTGNLIVKTAVIPILARYGIPISWLIWAGLGALHALNKHTLGSLSVIF